MILPLALALLAQDPADEARAALGKLANRMLAGKTLTADFTQTRRSALLEKPITSAGRLAYRRDPEALAFILTEPARSEVRFEKACYTVYRPDEKQLERFEFEDETVLRGLFTAFNPDVERVRKFAAMKLASKKDGVAHVVLEPTDDKARRLFKSITLSIVERDGTLAGISYTDADGDDVEFALSGMAIDAEVPPETFAPKLPEGVKTLVHKVKADK